MLIMYRPHELDMCVQGDVGSLLLAHDECSGSALAALSGRDNLYNTILQSSHRSQGPQVCITGMGGLIPSLVPCRQLMQ